MQSAFNRNILAFCYLTTNILFFEEEKGLIRPSIMGNFTNDNLFPVEKHYLNTLSLEAKYIFISVLTLLDVDSNHIFLSALNLRDIQKEKSPNPAMSGFLLIWMKKTNR